MKNKEKSVNTFEVMKKKVKFYNEFIIFTTNPIKI